MKRTPARFDRAATPRALPLLAAGIALLLLAACATPADQSTASGPTSTASIPAGEHDPAELSEMPIPRVRVAPVYPFELRKKGLTGMARVEFIITKSGDVVNAHAVAATYPEFGYAAAEAISHWKFRPGKKDGRPVNCRMQQDLSFDLATD